MWGAEALRRNGKLNAMEGTMKKALIGALLGVAFIAVGASPVRAADPAGFVDFGKLTPPASGGQFVEVNIKSNLIGMVAKLAGSAEPEVGELLRGLQQVRVNVIAMEDDNRAEVAERVKKIRVELDAKGWDRVVTVQDGNEDVGVFIKLRGEEAVEGLVVTVLTGDKEAVLVNIVGNIRPEQVALVGERFNIEPLKKAGEALKKG